MNNRRKFLVVLGASGWPLAVGAQQPKTIRRIGVLNAIRVPRERGLLREIKQRLAELGYVEGASTGDRS